MSIKILDFFINYYNKWNDLKLLKKTLIKNEDEYKNMKQDSRDKKQEIRALKKVIAWKEK